MVRKVPGQVADATARLLRAGALPQPVWYQAALNHPPNPLPPRQLSRRPIDSAAVGAQAEGVTATRRRKPTTPKLKIPLIEYELDDKIRRRFFKDFPFEALRPTSLVEGKVVHQSKEGDVSGKEWVELKQRSERPEVEDVIAFTINLHQAHLQPLSTAYATAVKQFVNLRAIDEIARYQAEEEDWYYSNEKKEVAEGKDGEREGSGHVGKPSAKRNVFQRFFDLEAKALDTLISSTPSSSSSATTLTPGAPQSLNPPSSSTQRKLWAPDSPVKSHTGEPFTGGYAYVDKWRTYYQDAEIRKAEDGERKVREQKEEERLSAQERREAVTATGTEAETPAVGSSLDSHTETEVQTEAEVEVPEQMVQEQIQQVDQVQEQVSVPNGSSEKPSS